MIGMMFEWNPAKAMNMKNRTSEPIDDLNDDLRPEYHFDYSKAKPNRFAVQISTIEETVTISVGDNDSHVSNANLF